MSVPPTAPHEAGTQRRTQRARNTARVALACSVLAFAVLAWAWHADRQRALFAYLTAYAFVLSIVLGSMAFVMISHAANATWPVAVRRLAESSAAAMPLLGLLLVPLLLGIDALYPWVHPERYSGHLRALLEHRRAYMNPSFFALRALGYVSIWSLIAWLLRRGSMAMEHGADAARCARRLRTLSSAGLPLLTLTAGFASFEWLMSLAPEWFSTMYGVNWIAMCLLAGIAWLIVLTAAARRSGALRELNTSHYYALGRLLFAFLIFLAYTAFFQFMLIWMTNLPVEITWYLRRWRGSYYWAGWFLIVGHFALPLLGLLSYRLKRELTPLALAACWLLVSHYLHLHWVITAEATRPGFDWLDPVALVAVAGLSASFGLWYQQGEALAAERDPRYAASLAYESR